ncbi:hypothetical protein [Nostoc sp.]|uniref:hypothetical protein n=1 Tax=Nostoc sp. TaxID=1180 RepID=UPI002FF7D88B
MTTYKLETTSPTVIILLADVQNALVNGCNKTKLIHLCDRISAITGIKRYPKKEPKSIHRQLLQEFIAYWLISDIWMDYKDFMSQYLQYFRSSKMLEDIENEVCIWQSAFDHAFPHLPVMEPPKYKVFDWVYYEEIDLNCVVVAVKPTYYGYFYIICPDGVAGYKQIILPEAELEAGQMPTAVSITGVVWEYRTNGRLGPGIHRIPVETDPRVLEELGIGKTVVAHGRLTIVEDAVLWHDEWLYSIPRVNYVRYDDLTFVPDPDTLPVLLKETKEHGTTIWQLDKDRLIIQFWETNEMGLYRQTTEVTRYTELAQRFPEYI